MLSLQDMFLIRMIESITKYQLGYYGLRNNKQTKHRTALVRPPLFHQKCGLSRGMDSRLFKKSIYRFYVTLSSSPSRMGGLSSRWSLKRGSTVLNSPCYDPSLIGALSIIYCICRINVKVETQNISHRMA